MPKKHKPTLADFVRELEAAPSSGRVDVPKEPAIRPSGFNEDGELFDHDGMPLMLWQTTTPHGAANFIADGALLAYELCGCGGFAGCQPVWVAPDVVSRIKPGSKPNLVDRPNTPEGWIDVWGNTNGTVVFLHGGIEWGWLRNGGRIPE
ncbi:hypothetical protein [Glaciihabitans sp. dw_435]|uniref:hypothetical protein n=1 Tax=Glaciihabitans sp. dw_435 TaxID=2720081 RepID=UPI001BD22449|nr:hypothetical protein [Glaciihabitans sp. dw_435]